MFYLCEPKEFRKPLPIDLYKKILDTIKVITLRRISFIQLCGKFIPQNHNLGIIELSKFSFCSYYILRECIRSYLLNNIFLRNDDSMTVCRSVFKEGGWGSNPSFWAIFL